MGQQQLLLLVLGIVIVGIAILVGINAYSENTIKTNFDALLQDALRVASDAQSWKSKPALFGGSPDDSKPDSLDFTRDGTNSVTFVDLGYAGSKIGAGSLCYVNLNGIYVIAGTAAAGLTIDGYNASNTNHVQLDVTGTLEENVDIDEANTVKGGKNLDTGADASFTAPTCTLS